MEKNTIFLNKILAAYFSFTQQKKCQKTQTVFLMYFLFKNYEKNNLNSLSHIYFSLSTSHVENNMCQSNKNNEILTL